MKKLLSMAVLLISISVSAQGNLQYDSTITINDSIEDSYSTSTSAFGPVYTVPAGKTWKMENSIFSVLSSSYGFTMYINSTPFRVNTSIWDYVKFPIWLKAGDTIQFEFNYASGSIGPPAYGYYFLSILQFNII